MRSPVNTVLSKFYTDQNFTTEAKYLIDGTYTVTEVKAPTGYALNSTGWTVVVKNGVVNEMTAGSAKVKSYTENGVTTFDMTNTPIYSLPNSGGSGIYWYLNLWYAAYDGSGLDYL